MLFVPGGSFEQVTTYLGVLHALRELGVTVWNDARAIERCVDKSTTTFFLHKAGIPTPWTWTGTNRDEACAVAAIKLAEGHRLVQKPLFGAQGEGLLSFPRPGITLSLDIPIDRRRTQRVVDQLNEHVLACGGRIYLAKDAFTRGEHFRAMEPRLAGWRRVREKWDPQQRLKSALSVRLLGDEP